MTSILYVNVPSFPYPLSHFGHSQHLPTQPHFGILPPALCPLLLINFLSPIAPFSYPLVPLPYPVYWFFSPLFLLLSACQVLVPGWRWECSSSNKNFLFLVLSSMRPFSNGNEGEVWKEDSSDPSAGRLVEAEIEWGEGKRQGVTHVGGEPWEGPSPKPKLRGILALMRREVG